MSIDEFEEKLGWEFWTNCAKEGCFAQFNDLLNHGYSDDEAIEFIGDLIHVVSGEWGC